MAVFRGIDYTVCTVETSLNQWKVPTKIALSVFVRVCVCTRMFDDIAVPFQKRSCQLKWTYTDILGSVAV